jgi:hypothetical protein
MILINYNKYNYVIVLVKNKKLLEEACLYPLCRSFFILTIILRIFNSNIIYNNFNMLTSYHQRTLLTSI